MTAESVKQTFAQKLKNLREEMGLSQTQLADKLNVSRGSISFYENSERMAGIDFIYNAARYFNCSTDYLLGLSDYKNTEIELELKTTLSKIAPIISCISDHAKVNFLEELTYFLESVNKLEHMPILSRPDMLSLHTIAAAEELRLLGNTANVISISNELQSYGYPEGKTPISRDEQVDTVKKIVETSYKTIDNVIPVLTTRAIELKSACTEFLDFMYKGNLREMTGIITTVVDLLGLTEKIKEGHVNDIEDGD